MWHSLSVSEVIEKLGTSSSDGLDPQQAQQRLEQHGQNRLREKPRPSFLQRLWGQLNDFLILILIGSAVVSGIIGWSEFAHSGETTEFIDAIAIMAIVVLNAIMGLVQEGKAEQALAALKQMAAPNATVIRGGRQLIIPAAEVVPGDLVVLETGNYIPADLRLIESVNLRIEEASLTGESVPVEKAAGEVIAADAGLGDRHNCGYMSTTVTYGRGRGIVIATGMETEIGRIAEMIQSADEDPTPLQLKLEQLGKWLGIASLAICAIVGLIGVVRDTNLSLIFSQGLSVYFAQSMDTLIEMFMIAVSLAIAAVPEGLPAVVTICLALGMQEMVKRHALIRRLPAVETLGSSTAICSDKTGTLTQNEMTVTRVFVDDMIFNVTGQGYAPVGQFGSADQLVEIPSFPGLQKLGLASALCNDSHIEPGKDNPDDWDLVGDPTEGALTVLAAKAGYWQNELATSYPRVDEVPFDSSRKRMSTIHRTPENAVEAYVKGAPDMLLDLCDRVYIKGEIQPLSDTYRQQLLEQNRSMASQALRVLGVAYRPLEDLPQATTAEAVEQQLVFIGLTGMIDPARPEVRPAIARARAAGIKTAMVTGDYADTAVAIARELELLDEQEAAGHVLSGADLDKLSDEELLDAVDDVVVYARVSPEHKVRIVDAHRQRGHIVAMTGDGVNDAPALKHASIGVAMGITGTDVSKETADMVLTDDNYASIVSAVEEGRVIYSNIRKFVYFLLSCNMGEIMILFVAMILNWPLPLTALQLLVLNLVTDGAPALALGMEKGDLDLMDQQPRPVDEPIINREMILGTVIQTIAIAGSTLAAFAIGMNRFTDIRHAQTMAFVTLAASELFRAYTARSERHPVVTIGLFSNKWMQWAVLGSLAVLFATVYVPGLNSTIFGNLPLDLSDWLVVFPMMLVPAVTAEVYKAIRLRVSSKRAAAATF